MREWILAGILLGSVAGVVAHEIRQTAVRAQVPAPHLYMCGRDISTQEYFDAFAKDPRRAAIAKKYKRLLIEYIATRFGPGRGVGKCA